MKNVLACKFAPKSPKEKLFTNCNKTVLAFASIDPETTPVGDPVNDPAPI
jgi:hypothetical protein